MSMSVLPACLMTRRWKRMSGALELDLPVVLSDRVGDGNSLKEQQVILTAELTP